MRQTRTILNLGLAALILAATGSMPVLAQGVSLQASPGVILGGQYRLGVPGQPSMSSLIKPEDLQRRPYDPNIIQYEPGVLPYDSNGTQSTLQGVISTPDGHTYISP